MLAALAPTLPSIAFSLASRFDYILLVVEHLPHVDPFQEYLETISSDITEEDILELLDIQGVMRNMREARNYMIQVRNS